jgi:hypothetical protein
VIDVPNAVRGEKLSGLHRQPGKRAVFDERALDHQAVDGVVAREIGVVGAVAVDVAHHAIFGVPTALRQVREAHLGQRAPALG